MAQNLIDEQSRNALRERFQQELRDDVHLTVFVGKQNSEYGDFTVQLVKELNELDGRIKYRIHKNGDALTAEADIVSTPTVLVGWDQGYRIKYTGAPAGHEAGGFIETISMVSRGDANLQDTSLEKLAAIDQDVTIQVFVTPTCPYCPRAVLLANQIAIAAKGKVTAECVEASQNMELARQFNVSSVPQQVINRNMASVSIGVQPESSFVDSVLAYGSSRYAETMAEEADRRALAEKLVDNPTGPVKLTDNNFDEAVAKYPRLVVDCWAEWCAPCRMVAPVVEKLAHAYQDQVVFGKLDVDHNRAISGRYNINSIPTMLLFRDGTLVGNQVGALSKPALEAVLKNHGLI